MTRQQFQRFLLVTMAIIFAASANVSARNSDGSLGALLLPNEGRPAIGAPGASITLRAKAPANAVLIQGEQQTPLNVQWQQSEAGPIDGTAELPAALTPGWYDLQLGDDITRHAVLAVDSIEDYYVFALLTAAAGPIPDQLATLAESEAKLAVLAGPGDAPLDSPAILPLLGALQACPVPVFIGAGADGPAALAIEMYFGPTAFGFAFGEDAYLFLSPAADAASSTGRNDAGIIQRLRRLHRAQRWSTAITAMPGTRIGIRESLILLLDDPVDFLVSVPAEDVSRSLPPRLRQGRTTLYNVPAAAITGPLLIDVTPGRGLLPRFPTPPEQARQDASQ